jgi:hypothetical protein
VFAEPAAEREARERAVEILLRATEDDVSAPAAEARLQDERQLRRGRRHPLGDEPRVRMRQGGEPERPRREQLVVCADERAGRVEHVDARRGEPLQLCGAALDSVELLADVEAPQREVAGLEKAQRLARRQNGRIEAQLQRSRG